MSEGQKALVLKKEKNSYSQFKALLYLDPCYGKIWYIVTSSIFFFSVEKKNKILVFPIV